MAKELTIEPDYSPIKPGLLRTRQIVESPGTDPPITFMKFEGIHTITPVVERGDEPRKFSLEVEYQSNGYALDNESVHVYLSHMGDAKISQDSLAQIVYRHFREALDLDHGQIWVQVSREEVHRSVKTQMGGIR